MFTVTLSSLMPRSSLIDARRHRDSHRRSGASGFDPLNGDWRVSLPCLKDDLSWAQGALKKHSTRITAREPDAEAVKAEDAASPQGHVLVFDAKGFLGS
jgi:hypothetical protein